MKIEAEFRDIKIQKELPDLHPNQTFDLDFKGHYLIQAIYKDDLFLATGNGIDGYGAGLTFDPTEVKITPVKDN